MVVSAKLSKWIYICRALSAAQGYRSRASTQGLHNGRCVLAGLGASSASSPINYTTVCVCVCVFAFKKGKLYRKAVRPRPIGKKECGDYLHGLYPGGVFLILVILRVMLPLWLFLLLLLLLLLSLTLLVSNTFFFAIFGCIIFPQGLCGLGAGCVIVNFVPPRAIATQKTSTPCVDSVYQLLRHGRTCR